MSQAHHNTMIVPGNGEHRALCGVPLLLARGLWLLIALQPAHASLWLRGSSPPLHEYRCDPDQP